MRHLQIYRHHEDRKDVFSRQSRTDLSWSRIVLRRKETRIGEDTNAEGKAEAHTHTYRRLEALIWRAATPHTHTHIRLPRLYFCSCHPRHSASTFGVHKLLGGYAGYLDRGNQNQCTDIKRERGKTNMFFFVHLVHQLTQTKCTRHTKKYMFIQLTLYCSPSLTKMINLL